MKHYYIECQYCEEETTVSTPQEEPDFCPMCGTQVNAVYLDQMDDSNE